MSAFKTEPLGPVVVAVDLAVLAEWIAVDAADPLLSPMATAATAAVIEFLERELITRNRRTTWEYWPHVGTDTAPSLSRNNLALCYDVPLPYAGLDTITTIEAGGDTVDAADYRVLDGFQTVLHFETIPGFITDDAPALQVTYSAGYGPDVADVPEEIRTAVMMAADFLYNNRGSCSASDALHKSGAATLLQPYRARAVIL